MRFRLEMGCDNAAFKDEDGETSMGATDFEVARLLETAACQVRAGYHAGTLNDVNGNVVGSWRFIP